MASGSRQQPGLACEECRTKKLRCDRRRPQCSICKEMGLTCHVNQARSRRGPKKGHLKALRSRIATLESQRRPEPSLQDVSDDAEHYQQLSFNEHAGQATSPPRVSDDAEQCQELSFDEHAGQATSPPQKRAVDITHRQSHGVRSPLKEKSAEAPTVMPGPEMSDVVEADLDQLYFDRVHSVAPIIHQGRYLSWSKQSSKSESHACLQFVMWTLAACASAHLQHLRESLYGCARFRLEALDNNGNFTDAATLAQAQAWLLLTHYEFRYLQYRQAWITAGRAFHIIRLTELHEVNRFGVMAMNLALPELWVEIEEKRRTFWLAYCLDRFVNITNEWLLSLHEELIWTCLPAPESDFQHSRPVFTEFLSEAIESSGQKMLGPFAEVIVLTTLCWRSLALKRPALMGDVYDTEAYTDSWTRHTRLYHLIQKRLALLSLPASSAELLDPMRLFTNLLANAGVIWLYNIMETVSKNMNEQLSLVPLYSANEIVGLTKPLTRSSFFKAHTFSPMLLFLSAQFLQTHPGEQSTTLSTMEGKEEKLQELTKALQILESGNKLAKSYLDLLESDSGQNLCNLSPLQNIAVTGDIE